MRTLDYKNAINSVFDMKKITDYILKNEWVAIAALTGLAAIIRLIPILQADFPLNEGGMFYVMAKNLSENHYRLPAYTSYNFSNIPFGYSPLAFYLMAGLHDIFHISYIDILRFVPLLLSLFIIPVIYFIAYELTASRKISYLVLALYVLMPGSFQSFIEGGGITRSPGFFFALLASLYAIKSFRTPKALYLLLTCISLCLSALFHIESVTFAVYTIVVLFLVYGRTAKSLALSCLFAVGLVLGTSWWWGMVVLHHGFTPYLSALHSNPWNAFTLPQLMLLHYVVQPKFDVLTGIYVIGLIICLMKKKWFVPVWLGILLAGASRMIPTAATVPLAFLAAYGITEGILPAMHAISSKPVWKQLFSLVLISTMVVSLSTIFLHKLSWFDYVTPVEREAMSWVRTNTDSESSFVVMTSVPAWGWFLDHTLEWFPVLTERKSVSTVQGTEWLPGFSSQLDLNRALKDCNTKSINCIDQVMNAYRLNYTHIYISKVMQTEPELNTCCSLLIYTLQHDTNYSLVYDGKGAMVFEKKGVSQLKRYADREVVR